MFAGHYDYEKGDLLGDSDLVIPAYDMKWNNYYNNDFTFLWEEYTWKATNFGGMKEETDKVKNVKACSPGENYSDIFVFGFVPQHCGSATLPSAIMVHTPNNV